nr:hypothetical protein [uncultured Sphingomonas sp.]
MAARTKLIALIERLLAASGIKEEEQPITGGIAFFSTQPASFDYLFYSNTFVQPNGHPDAPPRFQENAEREVDIALMPGARLALTRIDGIPQRWEARTSIPSIAAKDAIARRSLR